MIIRIYRAHVRPGATAEYEQVIEQALPKLQTFDGLLNLQIGRPLPGADSEFVMVSTWFDKDSLIGFTGEDWERPAPLPGEADLIVDCTVQHYESVGGEP